MRVGGIGEGTFSYTWSFPICPHRVSIELSVVEALQAELAESHEPRQGLLLGEIGNGLTHVDGWLRLAGLTPDAFADAVPKARRVIGYYTLREGSAFILSPSEVALANEHFQPGSVVLLVERRKKGPPEATFFFWRGDVFVHNLPLPFPFHAGLLSGESRVLPPPKPAANPRRAKSFAMRTVLLMAAAAIAGVLFASYFRPGGAHPANPRTSTAEPESISDFADWIPTEPRRDLELTWNSHTDAVANAQSGVLRVEDGGVVRRMTLGRGELLVGSILYAPASERIRVDLTTVLPDGRTVRSGVSARLADLGPSSTPAAPPVNQDLLAEAAKVAASAKGETVPPPPERRPPLKRFVWSSADRAGTPATPASDNLPSIAPPVASPNLTATNLPPVELPAPTLPAAPPPKAPAPAPAPVKQVPHSGRLIWTGSLPRRGIVEVDGHSVSLGTLTGALPGVPVNLTITPAEFDENGLLVYTTDAKRHNRYEPPSAANGWNRITYVWDPERVKQLAVLEYPNQSNNYSRLTLRSDARRCSLIFIDWSVR
jgi:hypothetical protein